MLLLLALSVFSSKAQETDEPSYLNSTGLLKRALDAVFAEIGSTPRVSAVVIGPETVIVRTQGKKASHHTDEWRITRFELLWMDRDSVDGPKPYKSKGIVVREEDSFFDFSEIAVGELSDVVGRAIAKAGLEDAPRVTSITIDRDIHLVPERRYGDIHWSIGLATDRESATVYADAAGRITSADLSQTIRAQRLDLLRQDDWPMADAQAELASVVGDRPTVHEVTVYASHLSTRVEKPGNAGQLIGYSWNYSGVSRGLVTTPNTQPVFGGTEPFRLSDLDFTALPKVKATALAAIGVSTARIHFLAATMRTTGVGKPQVTWRAIVKLEDSLIDLGNKMTGEVTISTTGDLVHVVLPASLQPAENWLKPAGLAQVVERLQREFGDDTRFLRILIDENGARAIVEDPRKPGTLAEFSVRPNRETSRSGAVSQVFYKFDPKLMFTLGDIAPLSTDRMSDLHRRTLAAMKLDGAQVWRLTLFMRDTTVPGKAVLTAELRAGTDHGNVGGWVVYGMDGSQLEVMTP